ncbi:hypothetical protein HBI56_000300 [Parastagonospora nodorum]|nr:hypothetical protein HBH52_149330 [Parastagonospora nodorum]KAH4041497.1 hypothetical protein HBI09_000610 [Parastagonospora nodorum]KAH4110884.1 hypothetical protein HBH46_000250 [Parastagonospora nodorum]KAH4124241.1 hypothetical protein HBH47_066850 [Parastagonospora nodorum]KAH4166271.1 hypothetical protein HBH43_138900 [Parastagonospora nodorum]
MVDASTLTIDTALETCHNFPQDKSCAICLFSLVPEPSRDDSANPGETDVVIAKVCGDKHHFHRTCIMAWFNSGHLPLNECPMDRNVLYGYQRVPQFPVNLPELTFFPGHNPEDHEAFYANFPGGHESVFVAMNPERNVFRLDVPAEFGTPISMVLDLTRESTPESRVSDLAILTRGATNASAMDLFYLLPRWDIDSVQEFNRIRSLPAGPDPLEGLSFTPPPQATPLPRDGFDHFLDGGLVHFWNPSNDDSHESTVASVLVSRETSRTAYQVLADQFMSVIEMSPYLDPVFGMAIADYMAEFPDPDLDSDGAPDFAAHAQRFWQINPRFRPDNAPPAEPEQLYPFNTLPDDGVEPRRYL